MQELARVAGHLHDIGKASCGFQAYIQGQAPRGGDHATAGAREAVRHYGPAGFGRLLALIIAGHHGGLADPETLDRRLASDLPDYVGWQAHTPALPEAAALQPTPMAPGRSPSHGLEIGETSDLAPRPASLATALQRTRVEVLRDPVDDTVLADAFARAPRMLCIVNSRAHARDVFERIRGLEGATHLTTLMCPAHRQQVLARLRDDLKRPGAPVRLVVTSLIEAGVDISFPEVWRASAGLDSQLR